MIDESCWETSFRKSRYSFTLKQGRARRSFSIIKLIDNARLLKITFFAKDSISKTHMRMRNSLFPSWLRFVTSYVWVVARKDLVVVWTKVLLSGSQKQNLKSILMCRRILSVSLLKIHHQITKLQSKGTSLWHLAIGVFTCSILASIVTTILDEYWHNTYKYWASTWKISSPASVYSQELSHCL